MKVLPNIPIAEDTILVKTFTLVVSLLNKHSISLSARCLDDVVLFVIRFIDTHKYVGICDGLKLLQELIRSQENSKTLIDSKPIAQLLSSDSILHQLIRNPEFMKKSASCHYDGCMPIEIKLSALFCLETLLSRIDDLSTVLSNKEHLSAMTKTLLTILYEAKLDDLGHLYYHLLMRSAITSCRYIGFANRPWCLEHVSDLLGICVATMLFGLPGFTHSVPQPVQPSQQALKTNEGETPAQATKKGGKLFKVRKPRQTPQNKNPKKITGPDAEQGGAPTSFAHSILFDQFRKPSITFTFIENGMNQFNSYLFSR